MESGKNKRKGTCYDCGGEVELIESNLQKGTKIVRCQDCYLFHFYKKEFLGGWKLLKVSKDPSNIQDLEK
jgi:DNA-directed RNA polymerase subunit RPC12/RpoP